MTYSDLQSMPTELLEAIVTMTEGRILRIEKDSLRMEEQQLMWSDDLAKEVIDYWLELNRYWLDKKIPPCTCADHENGFLAKEAYNDYFYEGKPCSMDYYYMWKDSQRKSKLKEGGLTS